MKKLQILKTIVSIIILAYFLLGFFNPMILKKIYYVPLFLILATVVYLPIVFENTFKRTYLLLFFLSLVITIIITKLFVANYFFLLIEEMDTANQILIPIVGYIAIFSLTLLILRLIFSKIKIFQINEKQK